MALPFGAGPRLAEAPIGDPSREAIASLRGYSYQLYASALSWMDLQAGEELYLEVAEDYSIAAKDALKAVQVKDTGPTRVTINSEGVRDAIESFVQLAELNPHRLIHIRYLTTSPIGLERATEDRVEGKATLEYWRQAATASNVSPLRRLLLAAGFSARVQQYINDRDDQALRDQLLKRIQWDCGQPPLQAVQEELAIRLAKYGAQKLGISAGEGRQLAGVIIKQVLDTVVGEKPRRLYADELDKILDDASSMRVPRRIGNVLLEAAVRQITGQPTGDFGAALVPRVLEAEVDRPMPPILTDRKALVDGVVERARNYGIATIYGGSGRGKTTVARLAAHSLGGAWHIVDLRNASAEETIPRLDQVSLELPAARSVGVILDDLNEVDDPAARQAVIRVLAAARRHDVICLFTAYNRPSARSLSDLGIAAKACVDVPDFTLDEVKEMIVLGGGDARTAQTIYIAGAFGHPQLINALISGLRSRSWPADELARLGRLEKSEDVEAEKKAARRQLVAAVPDDAKALLYRVSMVVGRFDRQLALVLAQATPAVQLPGQQLDLLIGPWVEQHAQQQLRVSPLLTNAGQEVLTPDEQVEVHRTVAEAYTNKRALDVTQADGLFFTRAAG